MVQNRGWCSPGLCAGPTHLPQAWIGCWTGLLNHARLVWRLASSLTDLDFADDVSLLAELLELLVPILETIASEATSLGFEVNWQKTKVQILGCREDMPLTIKVQGQDVTVVEEFVYLGCLIHSSTGSTCDISR